MEESEEKEGRNLLGSPTFKKLENGRFRCVQTGHELLHKDKDSYSNSKRCRLGLIDYALTRNKPPLTMFNQHSSSRSKLVCKLTGDTVNKSEEHIWKHLNGKRFLNKLELVEAGKLTADGRLVDGEEQPADSSVNEKKKNKKKKKKQKKKNKEVEQIISEEGNSSDKESESEEIEFWMPPAGERWDFDDGKDRWGSDSESDEENNGADGSDGVVEDDDEGGAVEDDDEVSEEVSVRTKKRVIEEVGPSGSSSRKKKKKKKESKQTVT